MSNVEFQYHGSCYDGFGAMWSAKQALETMGDPNLANANFQPAYYGKDRTDFKDKNDHLR
jgi:hypothetical protein